MTEIKFGPKLESQYHIARKLQATHDKSEYRCIGSGNCCKIGLLLPLAECAYIAEQLRRKYYLLAESEGFAVADNWFKKRVDALLLAMQDETWQPNGATEKHCAFFEDGCSIYEFRPMVCRAYGVIMPVADSCPRKRQPDGTVMIFHDQVVETLIDEWENAVSSFIEAEPGLNYTVYMPMGVLKFLLSKEEHMKLYTTTPDKFWKAIAGNHHRFRPESWVDD